MKRLIWIPVAFGLSIGVATSTIVGAFLQESLSLAVRTAIAVICGGLAGFLLMLWQVELFFNAFQGKVVTDGETDQEAAK